MNLERICIFLFCFLSVYDFYAQESKVIDSLLVSLKSANEDTNKVNTLQTLSNKLIGLRKFNEAEKYAFQVIELSSKISPILGKKDYIKGKMKGYSLLAFIYIEQEMFDKALESNNLYLKYSENLKYPKGIGNSYSNLGRIYSAKNDYSLSFDNYQKALQIFKLNGLKKEVADTYGSIATLFIDQGNYSEALKNQLLSNKIREELGDQKGIARSYLNMSTLFGEQGNYNEAIKYANESLKIKEKLNDIKGVGDLVNNIGAFNLYLGNYSEALACFFKSMKIAEELGNKRGISTSYLNIGVIYEKQNNTKDALINYKQSLKISDQIGNKKGAAMACNNIGDIYGKQLMYDSALVYFNRSLKLNIEMGILKGEAQSTTNVGIVYQRKGDFSSALQFHQKALKIKRDINDKSGIAQASNNIADLYVEMDSLENARNYLLEAILISKEIGNKELILKSYKGLAFLESKVGNYKEALNNYKLYVIYKDSLFNEESNKEISRLKTIYETEKSEKQISLLEKDKLLQQAALRDQQLIANERQHEVKLLEKEKMLQQLSILQKEGELEKQQEAVIAGQRKVELLNKDKKLQQFEIERQKIIRNVFIGAILFLTIIGYLYLRWKQREKAQQLERRLAVSEINALHSQMNPHFIFNALNAVHRFIWEKNPDQASEYLTRFSRLTRRVLENSREQLVPLNEDLSTLELYIKLEALNFEHEFSYKIDSSDLDMENVLIPPLLLQPFVENALKHGFRKVDRPGYLLISLSRINDELVCEVTDNGVGRTSVMKGKEKNTHHRSLGTVITSERLQVINMLYKGNARYELIDLADNEGRSLGTTSKIWLPFLSEL